MAGSFPQSPGIAILKKNDGSTKIGYMSDLLNAAERVLDEKIKHMSLDVQDFGATSAGVVTTQIQNCFDEAEAINVADPKVRVSVDLGRSKTYTVDGLLTLNNAGINGKGSTLYSAESGAINSHKILRLTGSNCSYKDFIVRYSLEENQTAKEAIELGDGTLQFSKNTLNNVVTRNAYRGIVSYGGAAANGAIWGTTFINTRTDNSWDWGWYLDCASGTTTLSFLGTHAKGRLVGGSTQIKGYYINDASEVVMKNAAADQMTDGQALQIINAQSVNIDVFTAESCEMITNASWLVNINGGIVHFDQLLSKVGKYAFGAGNKGHLLKLGSTCIEAYIGSIANIQDQAGASGTLYHMLTNNSTRVKTQFVKMSMVDVAGWYELFFDYGRIVGLANSDPSAAYTKTYELGDIAINRQPTTGGYIGWVCTVAGTPGTWKGFGVIA